MGPERARRAAEGLRRDPACALAIAGLCGAVDPSLRPGNVFVASELCDAEGKRELDSVLPLARALEEIGVEARAGCLCSVDHVVRGSRRLSFFEKGARVVDMESSWLAEAAEGRPLAILRVVVDGPDFELRGLPLLRNGVRALRALRRAAPALEIWAQRELAREMRASDRDGGDMTNEPSREVR
jgi:4-hydroxy-3-methylbut-2-enyl diphosphate reductase